MDSAETSCRCAAAPAWESTRDLANNTKDAVFHVTRKSDCLDRIGGASSPNNCSARDLDVAQRVPHIRSSLTKTLGTDRGHMIALIFVPSRSVDKAMILLSRRKIYNLKSGELVDNFCSVIGAAFVNSTSVCRPSIHFLTVPDKKLFLPSALARLVGSSTPSQSNENNSSNKVFLILPEVQSDTSVKYIALELAPSSKLNSKNWS
ncbi:hypothetical protein B0H19DRAFT_1085180 [Mycena capillaripes]|nr:hypothetical protein B0H19DRAFT_1085180 [Mycena capillaripes]